MKFLFALLCYGIGLSSLMAYFWLIRFGLDRNPEPFSWTLVARNILVFLVFPLQHSIFARARFKKALESILSPQLERPFYVGTSGLVLWLVVWLWKPFGPSFYNLHGRVIFDVLFGLALTLIVWSTVQMDHAAMFGLKQGYLALKGKEVPSKGLQTHGIYGVVRHPISSLLILALWSQASMTAGRFLFNLLFSVYAVLGTVFEERELIKNLGEEYKTYSRKVPAFIPRLNKPLHK